MEGISCTRSPGGKCEVTRSEKMTPFARYATPLPPPKWRHDDVEGRALVRARAFTFERMSRATHFGYRAACNAPMRHARDAWIIDIRILKRQAIHMSNAPAIGTQVKVRGRYVTVTGHKPGTGPLEGRIIVMCITPKGHYAQYHVGVDDAR